MFKHRQKPANTLPNITILDGGGNTLYDGRLTGIKLSDELIVRLSVEFFNDPEPCEIHRGAVSKRVFMNLIDKIGVGEAQLIAELDEDIRACFDAYAGAYEVRLYN